MGCCISPAGSRVEEVKEAGGKENESAQSALSPFSSSPGKIGTAADCLRRLQVLSATPFVEGLREDAGDSKIGYAGAFDACAELGLSEDKLKGVVKALTHTIDVLLSVVVKEAVHPVQAEAEKGGGKIDLVQLQVKVTEVLRRTLAEAGGDVGVGHSIQAGLLTVGWLAGVLPSPGCSHPVRSTFPYKAFYIPSVSEITVITAGAVAQPSFGFVGELLLQRGKQGMCGLFDKLGLILRPSDENTFIEQLPYYVMNSQSKAALLYVCASDWEQEKFNLRPVRRHCVLSDAMHLATKQNIFSSFPTRAVEWSRASLTNRGNQKSRKIGPVKIFPGFESERGVMESGEGHGPRKEFFDLAAEALTSEWLPPADLGKTVSASLSADSPYTSLVCERGMKMMIPIGARLLFRGIADLPKGFTSNAQSIEFSQQGDRQVVKIRLANPSPVTAPNVLVSLQLPTTPLFRVDGVSSWFNPVLEEKKSQEIYDSYAFAGWLAGQAIVNGVTLSLGLPSLFFEILMAWPDYVPSEASLAEIYESGIKAMKASDFKELLETEGLPASTTKREYVAREAEQRYVTNIRYQMTAFLWEFAASGILNYTPFRSCNADELRLVLQGRGDDGESDFDFRSEFRIIEPNELLMYQYNEIFFKIFWEVVDSGFGAATEEERAAHKRAFTKFVTGRKLLPAQAKQESIRIELNFIITLQESNDGLNRLPVSHTCDNLLELPNYMECILLSSSFPYNPRQDARPGSIVDLKVEIWNTLTPFQKQQIAHDLRNMLIDKFLLAILNSASYELDEIMEHQLAIRDYSRPDQGFTTAFDSPTDTPEYCTTTSSRRPPPPSMGFSDTGAHSSQGGGTRQNSFDLGSPQEAAFANRPATNPLVPHPNTSSAPISPPSVAPPQPLAQDPLPSRGDSPRATQRRTSEQLAMPSRGDSPAFEEKARRGSWDDDPDPAPASTSPADQSKKMKFNILSKPESSRPAPPAKAFVDITNEGILTAGVSQDHPEEDIFDGDELSPEMRDLIDKEHLARSGDRRHKSTPVDDVDALLSELNL